MILSIAYRNLLARPGRTLTLGGIIAFGACLAFLGASAAEALKSSLRRSLTQSVVGDLQLYSSEAKDELSLFSSGFSGRPKLAQIPEFEKIRRLILAHVPAVSEVVPQGFDYAMFSPADPLAAGSARIVLDTLGTDPAQMAAAFPLLTVLKGSMIPRGERGILINDFVYAGDMKNGKAARVGESITLRSLGQNGAETAVNLKIWGTFKFKNFENSPLAGSFNLVDMQSFRTLYGFISAEMIEETRAMKAAMQSQGADLEMARADENAMFGGPVAKPAPKARAPRPAAPPRAAPGDGPCLNAAVILKPGEDVEKAAEAIRALSAAQNLRLKVATWSQAAGLLGRLSSVFTGMVAALTLLVLGVGVIVMQNALSLAAMQRQNEIGTLRAIGASRGLVLRMILSETLMLSALFASLGAGLGLILVAWLGDPGIPAPAQELTFVFSGPRLLILPHASWALASALIATLLSLLAALLPALRASRLSPAIAIQKP